MIEHAAPQRRRMGNARRSKNPPSPTSLCVKLRRVERLRQAGANREADFFFTDQMELCFAKEERPLTETAEICQSEFSIQRWTNSEKLSKKNYRRFCHSYSCSCSYSSSGPLKSEFEQEQVREENVFLADRFVPQGRSEIDCLTFVNSQAAITLARVLTPPLKTTAPSSLSWQSRNNCCR